MVAPRKNLSNGFDVKLIGECDEVVKWLRARLGWPDATDPDSEEDIEDPRMVAPRTYLFKSG